MTNPYSKYGLVVPEWLKKIKISTYTAYDPKSKQVRDLMFIGSDWDIHARGASSVIKVNWIPCQYRLYHIDSWMPLWSTHTVKQIEKGKGLRQDCAFGKKGQDVEIPKELMEALGVRESQLFEVVYEYEFDKEVEWVVWMPDKENNIL